jgi:branched-chain amino acid transport system substrate-binding protein
MNRRTPLVALLVAMLVLVACGQKSEVASSLETGPGDDPFAMGDGALGGGGAGGAGGGAGVDLDGDGMPDVDSTAGGKGARGKNGAGAVGGPSGGSGSGSSGNAPAGASGGSSAGGDGPGTAGGGAGQPGGTGDGGTAPPSGGGEPGTPPPGGAPPGGGNAAPPPPGDRTGITDDVIRIGIHAPVTGAAPFPQNSFEEGRQVYWRWLDDKGGVFGRRVEVVFYDDKFDPTTAVQVCKRMVETDKVFLLIGGGGADQITQCARYAHSVGVPYLSAGVNEAGLDGVRAYFALSPTYAQQSPMLAQLIRKRFAGKKVALAVADSASFNDAHAATVNAFKQAGLQIVYDQRIPKSANQGQALTIANNMRTSGAEVVYFLSSPTTFLNVAAAGAGQGYRPQYVGPGITSGLQTVASVGCAADRSVDKAIFLSPFPQLDAIDKMDPEYQRAYRAQNGKAGDDIGIALWGLSKTLHSMFQAAGKDMSRQSFVATLESGKSFGGGVYPPVKYSAANHFGGSQVHAVQADCSTQPGQYRTIATFVSGF